MKESNIVPRPGVLSCPSFRTLDLGGFRAVAPSHLQPTTADGLLSCVEFLPIAGPLLTL
jgi:hypothetical protein